MTLSRSSPRAKQRWLVLVAAIGVLTILVSSLALGALPSAQDLFELDGNALADASVAGDDWQNIVGQSSTGSTIPGSLVASSFIGEAVEGATVDTTYFTGGGSKDVRDVSLWKYNGNSVPDKNQITNAYAAQYTKNGSQFIYFGADRFSNDGDSSLGFWFFKGPVSLDNGQFVGNHQDGDLFIVSDFSNGGSVGTVVAYRWSGGADGSLTGPITAGGDCATAPGTANICGRVNGSETTSPWAYTPKANVGVPGTFPANTFFEGGIDLTAFAGGQQVCFSNFLVETRSSTSTTAQLKDFALGGFDTCAARISISPSGVNAVGDTHTFTVKVERSFGGGFAGVADLNPAVTLTASDGAAVTGKVDACAITGTNADGECTVSFTSNSAGVVTGSASVTVPFPGTTGEVVSTNGLNGSSGAATKRFVDASVGITASAVNEVNDSHTFDITVTPLAAGTTVTVNSITATLSPAVVSPQTSSTTCDSPTLNTTTGVYSCTLTVNSPTATTFDANASVSLTFTGTGTPASATIVRDTSTATSAPAGPVGTGPATKRFVDASIAISPDDTNGIGESHTFIITVKKDEGQGGGLVAVEGVNPAVTLTASGGAAVANESDTCATAGTDAIGQCSVTFTSNAAGTIVGNASITLSVGGESLTRDTDGTTTAPSGPAGSGHATKTFVAGTLVWLKVDQNDDLLGGATFEVCRTHLLDSSTDPDSLDPDEGPESERCATVLDNSAPDADPANGRFKLTGLILGTYTIEETIAPEGYQLDDTIATVTLDLTNPDNSVLDAEEEPMHPDGIPSFVNERLYRLIVLTCNESTDTLVVSEVTLDGEVKNTISTVTTALAEKNVTASDLCALGGATYGGLEEGTYDPSIVIPAPPPPTE